MQIISKKELREMYGNDIFCHLYYKFTRSIYTKNQKDNFLYELEYFGLIERDDEHTIFLIAAMFNLDVMRINEFLTKDYKMSYDKMVKKLVKEKTEITEEYLIKKYNLTHKYVEFINLNTKYIQ